MMKTKIINYLARAPLSTLCLMTISFLTFGYLSFNLFFMFQANVSVIKEHGFMVLKDGAAVQLLQIILTAFMGVIFYTLWKLCERLILDWLTQNK